ncbi:MAG: hypothetical protein A3G27_03180 [Betaproteobacteria bacterium RIFCSPLOWO2_12_FULL_66_14]|nr:MAG: hypothetical protein A3G27_03180 [Betaproteobacteria bacterium RIFCSPLOWO2_12_FULL_66_14]
MDHELFAALGAALQGLELPRERIERAAAVALPVNERIAAASLQRLALDDHPADFAALLSRSAAA